MPDNFKHDKLFRKAMENPLVAQEFFSTHLPQNIRNVIDLSSLKMQKESFVEANLKNSICDVLFSVKVINSHNAYLYLLLEQQTKPDHFMAFRLFKYMVNICNRYLILIPYSLI